MNINNLHFEGQYGDSNILHTYDRFKTFSTLSNEAETNKFS